LPLSGLGRTLGLLKYELLIFCHNYLIEVVKVKQPSVQDTLNTRKREDTTNSRLLEIAEDKLCV